MPFSEKSHERDSGAVLGPACFTLSLLTGFNWPESRFVVRILRLELFCELDGDTALEACCDLIAQIRNCSKRAGSVSNVAGSHLCVL